ncbi:MAG: SdiA-regulated domain-containing protein [Bacteroidales bacterium]|nr:SdiA-regulated domain-containing protein [Bacteroidales bacterium]
MIFTIEHRILLAIVLILSVITASGQQTRTMFLQEGYIFPYNLGNPSQKANLPDVLEEVSGVSYYDENTLACIQDERGVVWFVDPATGNIKDTLRFGADHDYEDIEVVKGEIWALLSNGLLYRIGNVSPGKDIKVKILKTGLSEANNTEGLCYDPVENELLIACKEDPFINVEEKTPLRAIYAYNPDKEWPDPVPRYLINTDTLKSLITGYAKASGAKIREGDAEDDKPGKFRPSAVAVHPVTHEIYVLASTGKKLLVMDRNSNILAVTGLDPAMFPKPEGICFSTDGTLYISSEGKDGPGVIMGFEYFK